MSGTMRNSSSENQIKATKYRFEKEYSVESRIFEFLEECYRIVFINSFQNWLNKQWERPERLHSF